MATVNEDILTIYDDINAHEQKHADSNLDHDFKKEENESAEVTEHTKKKSSLLDTDYIPQTSLSADEHRKAASQSTESVQVYIYRRTSLVTSSGSASVMKIDDSDMTGSTHRSTETGMNLWDNTTTTIENYQLQEVNTWKKEENDTNPKQSTKSDPLVSEMEENKQSSIINLQQIKARRSIPVTDEKYNDAAIARKLSATSTLNQDDEPTNNSNENVSNRPTRSTSVIYYGEVGGNNTDSQINESMSNKNGVNESAMLQLIPSNHNRSKAQMHGSLSLQLDENELNEEFYKEISSERVAIAHKTKSKSMQFGNLPKIRTSETKMVDVERKYIVNVEDMDMEEEVFSPQMLTAQNLMVHDYAHSLHEMEDIEDEMDYDKKDNNRLRYIAMTDNVQQQQQASMSFLIQKKEKKRNNMKLSTRITYITAVGAICAVSILVGVVLYSRNNNEPHTQNRLMTPPRRRRLPPR